MATKMMKLMIFEHHGLNPLLMDVMFISWFAHLIRYDDLNFLLVHVTMSVLNSTMA